MNRLPFIYVYVFPASVVFLSGSLSLTLWAHRDKASHGYTLLFMPEHINVCVIRDNVWQATHQRTAI